jgi:hypothetical protein
VQQLLGGSSLERTLPVKPDRAFVERNLLAHLQAWRTAAPSIPEIPGTERARRLFASDEVVPCEAYAEAAHDASEAAKAAYLAGEIAAGNTYSTWSAVWIADYILCNALG